MKTTTRRTFLKKTAAVAAVSIAPVIVPAHVLGRGGRPAPSERITLGFIGMGGQGTDHNLASFLRYDDAHVLAVCDVDRARREKAAGLVHARYGNRDCDAYNDFREVIGRSDVDAVVISTPDHWHVLLSVLAARAGKDVFCEKPTLTVEDGRILSDTVRHYGTVFQAGTEDRSIPLYHRMAELVRNGRLGRLETIRVKLPAGYPQGAPLEAQHPVPIPDGFDYDLWLGPAPYAPYTPGRCHWNFRWIFDYSGGQLTDWGTHLVDTAQWANDTERTGPVRVQGEGVFPKEGIYNTAAEYHLEYEYANGVRLVIDSGGTSLRFEGTDGWVGNAGWRQPLEASSDAILNSVIGPNEVHLFTEPAGEQRNFLDCVRTRAEPYFPAEVLHRCSSLLHIGNISMLLGRALGWDPEAERFVNAPDADRMLSRPMRKPWHLPKPDEES